MKIENFGKFWKHAGLVSDNSRYSLKKCRKRNMLRGCRPVYIPDGVLLEYVELQGILMEWRWNFGAGSEQGPERTLSW